MITCIIPCYRSEHTIRQVVADLKDVFEERNMAEYEVILVNDNSPDGVFDVIKEICCEDSRIKGIDLAKNFGQHNAIMAGIKSGSGDLYAFMDDDGQTPASEIWKLIDALDDTVDIVFAKYANKRHALWRNMGSKVNDYMAQTLIGKPKSLNLTSYFVCKGFVAEEIKRYDGKYPYLSGLLLRSTSRIKNVAIIHKDRELGSSGYTFSKLMGLWLNGFTAFSVKPLRFASFLGIVLSSFGFFYGLFLIIQRLFISPDMPIGWSSIMAGILFIGGTIMVMLGIMGEYVGRIYISINNSPQFVVREKVGFDDDF